MLPDGRLIGHRQYAMYYKQKFRPEDTRKAVTLNRLALEYTTNGVKTSSALALTRGSTLAARKQRMSARKFARKFTRQAKRDRLQVSVKQNKLQGKYFRLQVVQ